MLVAKKIQDYLKENRVTWACNMPEGCPPEDILVPSDHMFYRYALNKDSYSADDFMSYAESNPKKDWGEMLPLAVGLSVLADAQRAKQNMKLPMLRKFNGIIALSLNPIDGVVKQTGAHKTHYTWWRTTSFNMSNLNMLEL